MRRLWRRAEVISEARDAADLRADRLIRALIVERAVDDVALDLIVGDCVPLEVDVALVGDGFQILWRWDGLRCDEV